jgi:hypothetical protein
MSNGITAEIITESNAFNKVAAPSDAVSLVEYSSIDSHNAWQRVTNNYCQNEGDVATNVFQPFPIGLTSMVPSSTILTNFCDAWGINSSHSGFCASSRYEVDFMMLAQACGTAMAIAVTNNCDIQNVPIATLQADLSATGLRNSYP